MLIAAVLLSGSYIYLGGSDAGQASGEFAHTHAREREAVCVCVQVCMYVCVCVCVCA